MILFEKLGISKEFLDQHRKTLRQKPYNAAGDMVREGGDTFAINQCLRIASSTILQFSMYLGPTLDFVRSYSRLKEIDPATIVTMATLRYLLQYEADRKAILAKDNLKIQLLRKRFNEINWLVGQEAMNVLGFQLER